MWLTVPRTAAHSKPAPAPKRSAPQASARSPSVVPIAYSSKPTGTGENNDLRRVTPAHHVDPRAAAQSAASAREGPSQPHWAAASSARSPSLQGSSCGTGHSNAEGVRDDHADYGAQAWGF